MPSTNCNIRLNLDVENIGPHNSGKSIRFSECVDSLKAIFYASNGVGKSFISRTFRLMSPDKEDYIPDELLTLGQSAASLALEITPRNEDSKKLSIVLQKGHKPSIQNGTGYLFHVFNSEYVKDNIEPNEYTPDGDIEGYILGKVQIDVTKEKKQEKQLEIDIKKKDKEIDDVIQVAQKELRDNGILSTLSEYSLINKEKLHNFQQIPCDKSFEEIVSQLQKLAELPDNIPDIASPTFHADSSELDKVPMILSTTYPKPDWDEEFVSAVKNKIEFVEQGLTFIDDNEICPFCKQPLGTDALDLIQRYKAFLSGKEMETVKKINGLIQVIRQIIARIEDIIKNTELANAKVIDVSKYFPSLKGITLTIPHVSMVCFELVNMSLETKANNLSIIGNAVDMELAECKKIIDDVKKICTTNAEIVSQVNSLKSRSHTERLNLRRSLCNAEYIRVHAQLLSAFQYIKDKTITLDELRVSIKKKEERARVSKKGKVYETLKFYLNLFFADKYTIDEDTFFIKFLGTTHSKASTILSDGEKSIVAFCFYLASTHLLIEKEDDYNKLFFIIDDPISSMDFNFVYAVAQSLRDIKAHFRFNGHERMFVFTHNLEFYSIITRNHIIMQAYVMKSGEIAALKQQLLMPYEHHLYDIVKIARGQLKPMHTTGNSIRHVLETVSRFEYPEKKLEKYISENDTLKNNSCIFSLCQDLSHGAVRLQPPFDEQVFTDACQTVVTFMEQHYHGQIEAINDRNQTKEPA